MKAADQAKHYGAKSLLAVSEFTGHEVRTLRRYHKDKPQRFRALCVACVCDELGLTGDEIRAYYKLKQTIEG